MRAKNVKKYPKNAESDQTHDDVGKNVANAIFANETISFDFYLNYAMTIVKNLELPFKSLLNQVECIL